MTKSGRAGHDPKTLAMRLLERERIPYQAIAFPETIHDALGVAAYAGLDPQMVYKTLVVQVVEAATGQPSRSAKPSLILIAAGRTLDLKKVARGVGVRKMQMARQTEAERLTGLKVGGISALALLQRGFMAYIDLHARQLDEIVVSAGQRGLNLRLRVDDLVRVISARWIDASLGGGPPEAAA